jgi:hypothetical protein
MRSGDLLDAAVEYLNANGIDLWAVNENPEQDSSQSPKVYAQKYIDDAAMGCPLVFPDGGLRRPYVDWPKLFPEFQSSVSETGSTAENGTAAT